MDWIQTALRRFGQEAVIRGPGGAERRVRAFLQPVFQNDESLPGDFTSAGWTDRRLWRYTGAERLAGDDQVLWQGFTFRVRSCREVFFRNAPCYWRASLEREKEDAYEGT